MEIKKSYYAIIPANVRYDADLTASAKLLYGEITALCNEKGYCWANNHYFSKLYEVDKRTISRWINQLVEKGYLTSEFTYREGVKEIKNRYLRLGTPIDKIVHTPRQDCPHPIDKIVQDSTTVLNTTSNNTLDTKDTVANATPPSEKPNKYNFFFDMYNKQEIVSHRELTNKMKQAINRALKKDKQEEILKAIERYGEAYRDKGYIYADFKMTLDKFLTQSNGYSDWLDEGQKWINYSDFKDKGATYGEPTEKHNTDDRESNIAEQAGILSF